MKLTQSLALLLACCTTGVSVAQERIVSAGSAVTELMLALGAEQHLIAVDVTSEVPSSLNLPTIGYHRRLAAEGLLALAGAGIGYLNYLASDQMLRDLTLWSMGSMAGANTASLLLCSATLLLLFGYFRWRAMALNALLLGEAEARHLGVPVQKLKREMILLSAIGVGVAVSAAGMIGFVGLVVPHIGRMLVGPDHRNLVPISALLGALMLTLADMVARVAVAPAELPIGIVTALVGAPFFLYLLFQQKGRIF